MIRSASDKNGAPTMDLNPEPSAYRAAALPLRHEGVIWWSARVTLPAVSPCKGERCPYRHPVSLGSGGMVRIRTPARLDPSSFQD